MPPLYGFYILLRTDTPMFPETVIRSALNRSQVSILALYISKILTMKRIEYYIYISYLKISIKYT